MPFLHYDRSLPGRCNNGIVQRNRVGFSTDCASGDMIVNDLSASVGFSTGLLAIEGSIVSQQMPLCGVRRI
jgi:hypothetical protein